ncbi:hypothetical protein HX867_35505, partial [Pseudomonas gingeri]|uniref:hypothetical protein n=1 Tax=Pseudomonas gingeri TaxID=117681 RepID=UPI00159FFBB0
MDFRVLLAVGIALGGSWVIPLAGSTDGLLPLQVLPVAGALRSKALHPCPHTPVPPCVSPIVRAEFVLQSSSLKNAVFRTVLHKRQATGKQQAEGARFSGSIDELPLKEHLPV